MAVFNAHPIQAWTNQGGINRTRLFVQNIYTYGGGCGSRSISDDRCYEVMF